MKMPQGMQKIDWKEKSLFSQPGELSSESYIYKNHAR